jgi:hypothetical protein
MRWQAGRQEQRSSRYNNNRQPDNGQVARGQVEVEVEVEVAAVRAASLSGRHSGVWSWGLGTMRCAVNGAGCSGLADCTIGVDSFHISERSRIDGARDLPR